MVSPGWCEIKNLESSPVLRSVWSSMLRDDVPGLQAGVVPPRCPEAPAGGEMPSTSESIPRYAATCGVIEAGRTPR